MLIKRFKEYHLPFSFCEECKKFSPFMNGCVNDDSCKAAVKLYKKYTRKEKEVLEDELLKENEHGTLY